MFRLSLFRIRAFAAGNVANLMMAPRPWRHAVHPDHLAAGHLAAQHGYSFSQTPLWAGIYLVPLTIGFLVSAPLSGWLSDRFGARAFTVVGALLTALSFAILMVMPVDFSYGVFAAGAAAQRLRLRPVRLAEPGRDHELGPAEPARRGAGTIATFTNASFVLSIGIFFSLIVAGLSSALPGTLSGGLIAQGIPASAAHTIVATCRRSACCSRPSSATTR